MIVSTISKLLFALLLGYILNKKGILDESTNKKISYIIMQVSFPCMIICSVSNAQSGDRSDVLKLLIVGFIIYACLPFISMILAKCLNTSKTESSVYQAMFIFSNFLFIGYPVSAALYGEECIFYISILHMIFNVLYYSYGIHLITKGSNKSTSIHLRQIINNGIIASFISLILFFFNIPLPSILIDILSFIGNISTPVSMLIIGATIGSYALNEVFYNKKLIIVAAIRLFLFPIIIFYVMTLLGFHGVMRGIATITMGMPVASAVSMTSIEYGCNQKLASMSVVITTLFSIVTIPVMLILLRQ